MIYEINFNLKMDFINKDKKLTLELNLCSHENGFISKID